MADFLASFNLGPETPAPSNNASLGSVDEMQMQLQGQIESRSTPNRAEHVSMTMELRATVQFVLSVSEAENNVLENLSNTDPALGGARSTSIPAGQEGGRLSRVVYANESLMNQPQDNPALQRAVAKHIVSVLGATDGSVWTVREVSRGAHGWTFTYLCKDSAAQWIRQNSKNPSKAIVGEFSMRELDPVLSSRPAFDCRGSVTIAFNRSSRSITVRYDHTPVHKTVAELSAYFQPPPRQLGPGAQRQQEQKQKARNKSKSEKRAQDENGNPRKRKRGKKGETQDATTHEGPVMPPDYPGAVPVEGPAPNGPSYASTRSEQDGDNAQGYEGYPQGLVGDGRPEDSNAQTQQANAQPATSASFPVNVTPAEAARRRDVAMGILRDAGLDPATLSTEQFNIFANQSPELQKESLSMLVKYGAERLRIVHPSNRAGSASAAAGASTAAAQISQATPSGPMTTNELVPESARGSNADINGLESIDTAISHEQQPNEGSASQATAGKILRKKMGKSRTACFSCKDRKVKCPKERPVCAECQTHGHKCEYVPPKPRKKKSAAEITAGDEADDDDDDDAAQEDADEEETHQPVDDDGQQSAPHYPSYAHLPVANLLTTNTTGPPQTRHSEYSTNHWRTEPEMAVSHSDAPAPQKSLAMPSGLTLSQVGQSYSSTAAPEAEMEEQTTISQPEAVSPRQKRRAPKGSASGTRHGLPSGSSRNETQVRNSSGNPPPTSTYSSAPGTTVPPATMLTVSPAMAHSTSAAHHQPSRQTNQYSPRATAAAAIQADAIQSSRQPMHTPRTRSRQSQKSQTRAPVVDQSVTNTGYHPLPELEHQTGNQQMSGHAGSVANYSNYSRYNNDSTSVTPQPAMNTRPSGSDNNRNAAIAMSISSQAPLTMPTSYPSSTQWSSSGGQGRNNALSYSDHQPTHSNQTPYSQPPPSAPTQVSASLQDFNMRGAAPSNRSTTTSSAQQRQQQQSGHTSNHQNSWYNFHSSNNASFTPGSSSAGYSWKVMEDSW